MMTIPSAGVILSTLFTFYTSLVTIFAFFSRYILPPEEKFNDWPRFQGYYKFLLVIVNWIAFNKQNGNGGINGSVQVPSSNTAPGK